MSGIDPANVSAVLVTRGNVDMAPILDSLIFDDVVVWDNSKEKIDQMTYGRALATQLTKHEVCYSQDDDIIHSPENQLRLCAEYQPGVLTGCMWEEWSYGAFKQGILGGYSDLVFAGSGSIYHADLPHIAAERYLKHFPFDDFFRLWADTIIGILAPNRQIDMRFEERPEGNDDYRMAHLPNGPELKGEAIRRARWVRDLAAVAV